MKTTAQPSDPARENPAGAPPPPGPALTLLAASVVVHDRTTERVLMLRRGPRAKFGAGLWDLPVGKCDPGEPVTRAAARELEEETGLRVEPEDLRLAHVVHGAHGAEAPQGFLTVVFVTERWSGQASNREPGKHSAVRWQPLDDLPGDCVLSADRVLLTCLRDPAAVTEHGWS